MFIYTLSGRLYKMKNNRKIIITLFVIVFVSILTIGLYIANLKKQSDVDVSMKYELTTEIYNNEDVNTIKIEYPKLIGMIDTKKQDKINQIIKSEALEIINYYSSNDSENMPSIDVECKIGLNNKYILSIEFFGLANDEQWAHPHKLYYTTNIDICTQKELRFVNLVKVDDNLIKLFKNEDFECNLEEQIKFVADNYGDKDIKDIFLKCDSIDGVGYIHSSLTNNSLKITLPALHVIGGHINFEIDFSKIKNNISDNSIGWVEFLKNCNK